MIFPSMEKVQQYVDHIRLSGNCMQIPTTDTASTSLAGEASQLRFLRVTCNHFAGLDASGRNDDRLRNREIGRATNRVRDPPDR